METPPQELAMDLSYHLVYGTGVERLPPTEPRLTDRSGNHLGWTTTLPPDVEQLTSARRIDRACEEDVAFRVIAMLERPDHATIAQFVDRHEAALADLFGQVVGVV